MLLGKLLSKKLWEIIEWLKKTSIHFTYLSFSMCIYQKKKVLMGSTTYVYKYNMVHENI